MKHYEIIPDEFKQKLFELVFEYLQSNEDIKYFIENQINEECQYFFAKKNWECSPFYGDLQDEDFNLIFSKSKHEIELEFLLKKAELIANKMFEQFLKQTGKQLIQS
jgi:hypothetical protein